MPKNWYETGAWTPQESWRAIRNLRADPPAAVAEILAAAERADVFHMALEQSEQLFRSAAAVERETRPILLFYGLGQAGRAIAAASKALGGNTWRASGHGLKSHLNGADAANIWDLRTSVTTQRSDLFSRTTLALGSATDIADAKLGEAAANILEFNNEFNEFKQYPRAILLGTVSPIEISFSAQRMRSVRFPLTVDDAVVDDELLTSAPALSHFHLWREEGGAPRRDEDGNFLISVPSSEFEIRDGIGHLRTRQRYRGTDIAVRAIGGASTSVHPLIVWWLVLYPLSMLARYEPRKWQQVLDVRTSASWSQIEFLIDRALDGIPQLLAEALSTLNRSER